MLYANKNHGYLKVYVY